MSALEAWLELAERALLRAGARVWEVAASEHASASVEVVDGRVRAEESARERSLGIRVIDGGLGFAGVSDPSPERIARAVESALAEARAVRATPLAGFAGPARAASRGLDFCDPSATGRPRASLVERARALEAAAMRVDRRVRGVRPAAVTELRSRFVLRSSEGARVEEDSSRAYASVGALAGDGEGDQLVFAVESERALEALDLARVGRRAAERAVALLGAVGGETATVPVVFAPEVVAELCELLAGALVGERVDRRASFAAGWLDRPWIGSRITLIDDPHDPRLDGAAWFDGEGLPTQRITLIDRGYIRCLLDDLESAARGGRRARGHAHRAGADARPAAGAGSLRLEPGERSRASLLSASEGGVYVEEVSGAHMVSEITGAISLGAIGRRIRGGALAEPLEGLAFASTLRELFGPTAEPGAELEIVSGCVVPVLWVPEVQLAAGGPN